MFFCLWEGFLKDLGSKVFAINEIEDKLILNSLIKKSNIKKRDSSI